MDEKLDTTTPATNTSVSVAKVAMNEALSDVIHRLQATLVREPISEKIKEFHAALAEVAQQTAVLKHATKRIIISGEPSIMGEHTIVDAANHLRQVSDAILEYLDFMKEKTGLPSGGDTCLEVEAKDGIRWAKFLLDSFKLVKKIERSAGGLIGIHLSRVTTESGKVECLKLDDDGNNNDWDHPDIMNPLLRSPGTQWHKFFSDADHDAIIGDRVVSYNRPRDEVNVLMPDSTSFIRDWIDDEFLKYSTWFDAAGRATLGDVVVEDEMSAVYAEAVECGLAPTHIWSTVSDPMILHRECLSQYPQVTPSGRVPLEEMNFTISQNAMDGGQIRVLESPTLPLAIMCSIENILPGEEWPLD